MLKTCILEAKNTFSHQNRLKNMDTVTIKKYLIFRVFLSPLSPFLVEIQIFGHIQKVHVTARRMTFFASKSAQ